MDVYCNLTKDIARINIRPKANSRSRGIFLRCFRVPAQGRGNMMETYSEHDTPTTSGGRWLLDCYVSVPRMCPVFLNVPKVGRDSLGTVS